MSLDTTTAQGQSTASYNRGVSAFFDTQGAAQKATDDLIAAGIARGQISMTAGQAAGGTTAVGSTENKGFLESLKDLFLPEEDRYAYAEGLRRGGYLLTVRTDTANYDRVLGILDADGAVDIDERETQWKSEGWTGYGAANRTSAAATSLAGTTGRDAGVTTGTTAAAARPGLASGAAAGAVQRLEATSDETVPVYEERLTVGKRDVSHGRVRLRSYVVETPVTEQVSLRNEQIQVDRRPVDRPVAAGEALFQDRVIEAEERAEEAVVAKDVRIKEEISLRKTADNRTQTINDTVRRTEVEIDDNRGHAVASSGAAASFSATTDSSRIVEHMDVIASDGTKIGVVDHLDGPDRIKLAKNASPDGQHHFVPLAWVDHIDTHVHLNKTSADAKAGW